MEAAYCVNLLTQRMLRSLVEPYKRAGTPPDSQGQLPRYAFTSSLTPLLAPPLCTLKTLLQVLQGSLPEEYQELREPSVPDLSYVLGQVHPLPVTIVHRHIVLKSFTTLCSHTQLTWSGKLHHASQRTFAVSVTQQAEPCPQVSRSGCPICEE